MQTTEYKMEIKRKWKKQPIAKTGMQVNNKLLFILIEKATFQVGAEVIGPAETTTFATTAEASELGEATPATLALSDNKIDQFSVFLGCPRPLFHSKLVAARLPSHHFEKTESHSNNVESPTHPPIYSTLFHFLWVNHEIMSVLDVSATSPSSSLRASHYPNIIVFQGILICFKFNF